jgi:predicted dehydrogenase
MKALAECGAEICALVDPQEEMIRGAREVAPDAKVVRSFGELLQSGLDGVVIATPSGMHAEQTIAALDRGIAVFCQKPLGINATETKRAIDAARRSDSLLKVDLCYRFVEGARQIRELIQNGELGDVFAMELVFHNAYGPDKGWFYDPARSGGGCLIDLGIHLIDLALWLLDFPAVESVAGNLLTNGRAFKGRAVEVEDFAQAAVRLANGANVNVSCSWKAHAGQDAVIEASVFGSKSGAKLRNVNGSFYDFAAEHFIGTSRRTLAVPPDEWGGRAAIDWLNQLCKGNHFDPVAEELGIVAEVIDRIYER